MKADGPKHERETIINFNEEDGTATIWTASQPVYRRLLKRLGRAYLTEDRERSVVFEFPKKWLNLPRFRPERAVVPKKADHMAKMRASKRL